VGGATHPADVGQTQSNRPRRLEAADALRALATVFVVVIHTSHWPTAAVLYNDLDLLSRFAVPAFMLLTGVLLSYQHGGEPDDTGAFVQRRFSRTLLPWLVWAPIYALTGWLFTGDVVPQSVGGLLTFLSYGAGHLWFLLLIPQMYLLYLVWPHQRLWLWAIVALAVQTGLAFYRLYGPMPLAVESQLTLWHGFQLLPFWAGYFALGLAAGRWLADSGPPKRVRASVVAVAAAATVVSGVLLIAITYGGAPHGEFQQGTGGFLLPQEPLLVVSVAALVLVAGPALVRRFHALAVTAAVLSDNSLAIYILHPLLIYLLAKRIEFLLTPGLPTSFVGFLVLTVGGLAAATLASVLLAATPLAPTLGVARHRLDLRRMRTSSSRSTAD
jgi:surface polysaccharide O-acyltransferase-like enzyme